ncbi:MAG: ammonia-forming cytochrome c nitrite reductase subunit c552 [Phycisphaerales bacterium]
MAGGTGTSERKARWTTGQAAAIAGLFAVVAIATVVVLVVLVQMFEHKQAERVPFVRVVEVNEVTTDPVPWGQNWPSQFDSYRRTVDATHTRYGGSEAMPESKLEAMPWVRRLFAGYAFSIDYRERRGHAYMLYDQEVTRRVTERNQSGACLHCHASIVPTYRRLGLEDMGEPADEAALGDSFNWPAVMRGFELVSRRPYPEVHAELLKTPDGTPGRNPLFPGGERAMETRPEGMGAAPVDGTHAGMGEGHPVSCVDCHDPESMAIRVTRPGFVRGIALLAASDAPVPHLPSVERWRKGSRSRDYDPNLDASRQEMRSFACAQCHVEYYCATEMTLTFPWGNGLRAEDIERFWEETTFPSGKPFSDFKHGETGARMFKAQHPEFELWSQGIHARAGVSCADCHMPYERQGAMKVSSHWVKSPLLSINNSCQTCHKVDEDELLARVHRIQDTTKAMMDRAAVAMTDMLDAINAAIAAGATEEELAPILELQRKGMWRLDYVLSENSMGFHAPQEAARLLGESMDYSRRAQAMAIGLRAGEAPAAQAPDAQIIGVTPTEEAPPHPAARK